jgi:hypothetical protein
MDYYSDNVNQYIELKKEATIKKISFLRQCLVLAVSLTGFLVALYDASNTSQSIRMAFSLTIVLLVACLLLLLRAIYILDVEYACLLEEDYLDKLLYAIHQEQPMPPVAAGDKKRFQRIEKASYVLFV